MFVRVLNLDNAVSRLESVFSTGAPMPVAVAMGCSTGREKLARLRDLETVSLSSRLDGRWPSWSPSSSYKLDADELELDSALLLVLDFRSGSIASSSAREDRDSRESRAVELASGTSDMLAAEPSVVVAYRVAVVTKVLSVYPRSALLCEAVDLYPNSVEQMLCK